MIKKLKPLLKNRTFILIFFLILFGGFTLVAASNSSFFKDEVEIASLPSSSPSTTPSAEVLGLTASSQPLTTPKPSKTPAASVKNSPQPSIKSSTVPANSSAPSSNSQTGSTSQASSAPQSSASTQPVSTPQHSPSTQPEKKQVNLEIQSPDGSNSFQIEINEGMNVCDVLQKAKDQGKINSLTFDDQYLASFNSKYVYEINGHKNNWTFKVNGNSPLGCSLHQVKANDSIVWKFN